MKLDHSWPAVLASFAGPFLTVPLLVAALLVWSASAPAQEPAPAAPAQGGAIAPTQEPAPAAPAQGGAMMPAAAIAPAEEVEEYEQQPIFAAPWQSRPTMVRTAVVNASGVAGRGAQVAVLLQEVRRLGLERRMGMRLEVVNASNSSREQAQSVIFYRPGYLRAALALAEALPGDQAVERMKSEDMKRTGFDVEIWLGRDLP